MASLAAVAASSTDAAGQSSSDVRRDQHLEVLQSILQVDAAKLERLLITSVLVWLLSQDTDLALLYIVAHRPARSSHCEVSLANVFAVVWDDLLDDDTFALHCVVELLLPEGLMLTADRFVMERILVGEILQAASVGVVLPLDQVIDKFLSLWLSRSSCGGLETWLSKLAHHQNTRRKFGVHLRSVWNMSHGSLRSITSVDHDSAQQKAMLWKHGWS